MIKSWLISFFIVLMFFIVYKLHLLTWLASSAAFWMAVILVLVTLAAAFLILGNPLKGMDGNDDEDTKK